MIIFAFLAFLIIGLIAIAAGFVLNWLSGLISPFIASLTGKDEPLIKSYVQTAMLFVVALTSVFLSQGSCSYGNTFHREDQKVVSLEEITYIGLGWVLMIIAIICFGVAVWRLKIAIYGSKEKVKKVF
jgi:hypothetical protein